jgi:hypothetical protein
VRALPGRSSFMAGLLSGRSELREVFVNLCSDPCDPASAAEPYTPGEPFLLFKSPEV